MKAIPFILIIVALVLTACKKDKEYCWQVFDQIGNPMGTVCGKTEKEIREAYGNFYERANAPKYCWVLTVPGRDPFYVEDLTEKMISLWHSNATNAQKVECGYCAKWLSRTKHVAKVSGVNFYSQVSIREYCGDTVSTIFEGRTFILRETPDSIIYHEFMTKQ